MPIHQTYLSWDEPCLPLAADWVLSQKLTTHEAGNVSADLSEADLSNFTLVVSSSRAGRRLLEILVERTTGQAMTPPRIVTLSKLPEFLYTSTLPQADELMTWMLRAQAIHQTPPATLKALLPHPPKADDAIGQLTLAQEIQTLADELAAHHHTFASVATQVASLVDFDDHTRWDVLAQLDEQYHQLLTDRNMNDTNLARAQALAGAPSTEQSEAGEDVDAVIDADSEIDLGRAIQHQGRLVLIAVTDVTPVVHDMLAALQTDVDILMHAPASHADGFDHVGRLLAPWWDSQRIHFDPAQIHLLNRPADQAYHVPALIHQRLTQHNVPGELPGPDQFTVGLGDPNMAPLIIRTLDSTNVPSRHAAGRVINQSTPAVLLQHIASLLTQHTTRELAHALRCPAIEARVRADMGDQSKLLLTHLDTYIGVHLPHRLSDVFLEDAPDARHPEVETPAALSPSKTVTLAWQTLLQLIPAHWDTPAPLATWGQPIAKLLETFFGQRDLQRFDPDDAILIRAIQAIAQALEQQATAPADLAVLSQFTLPQAINLLLIQIAGKLLPPESGDAAVELLGWLELQMDDAPHLILTGFNEGSIPQAVNNHWLLPDTLRQKLALPDNHSRFVRESYMLHAMLHSRESVHLIAGRTSSQGDPLTPSRLLLAGAADQLPQWILRFYKTNHDAPRAPLLLAPGRSKHGTFDVPRPLPLTRPITGLNVTAFRDYIACPYRFYLKYVLKLRTLDDSAVEMDAMTFGNMAHDILKQFAQSKLVTSPNPQHIANHLIESLHQHIEHAYGPNPPGVIHIQEEILTQRLTHFAHWQANEIRQGWQINAKLVERPLQTTLDVDGSPFTLQGRIDRADFHPELGHRLLDYKTGDTHKLPDKTHRKPDGTWTDLQLPLYHKLASSLDLQGNIGLGYVLLPKDLRKTGLAQASWGASDIESAIACAHDIIRNIREEKFWPPTQTPFDDEFAAICMDHCLNKPAQDQDPTTGKGGVL